MLLSGKCLLNMSQALGQAVVQRKQENKMKKRALFVHFVKMLSFQLMWVLRMKARTLPWLEVRAPCSAR